MASTSFSPRARSAAKSFNGRATKPKRDPKIIHQAYFKSVGPRTYAAQVKEMSNGNHLLVLTEGKRDEQTNELRKTSVFVYAEDFSELFKMLDNVRQFTQAHPVSPEAKAKRDKHWARAKQTADANAKAPPPPSAESEDDELDR